MKTCEEMYQEIHPLIANERNEAAATALEKLLEKYPDFAQGHNDLGFLYHRLKYKEKALFHLKESSNLEVGNIVFLKNTADFCYSEMGDGKDALKYYQKVLEIKPDDIDALMISGHITVTERRFDEAKQYYKKVLDYEPWNDEAWAYLDKLETYIDSSTDEMTVDESYQRCQKLASSESLETAIKEYESLLKVDPNFALAYNDLGVLHYNMGDKEKALECYEKAATLEPGNATLQKNLADFYYVEMGRVEDALEIYSKVLTEEPADVESLMAAGQISEAFNKKDNAKVFYDRVLDIEPWNLEASENLDKLCES